MSNPLIHPEMRASVLVQDPILCLFRDEPHERPSHL